LELGQHRLLRQHQNAIGSPPAHQFGEDHPDLDRLAQTNSVGQ
jgi:hypothetical protein